MALPCLPRQVMDHWLDRCGSSSLERADSSQSDIGCAKAAVVEALLSRCLSHPHIVPTFACGVSTQEQADGRLHQQASHLLGPAPSFGCWRLGSSPCCSPRSSTLCGFGRVAAEPLLCMSPRRYGSCRPTATAARCSARWRGVHSWPATAAQTYKPSWPPPWRLLAPCPTCTAVACYTATSPPAMWVLLLLVAMDVLLWVPAGWQGFVPRVDNPRPRCLGSFVVQVLLVSSVKDARRWVAQVADFGLAQTNIHEGHVDTPSFGTVTHMPPELLADGKLSQATDVYSFGCLLLEMCTGQRAWAGCTDLQVLQQVAHRRQGLEVPDGIPPALHSLVHRCLSPVPAVRPPFSQILPEVQALLQAIRRPERQLPRAASSLSLA